MHVVVGLPRPDRRFGNGVAPGIIGASGEAPELTMQRPDRELTLVCPVVDLSKMALRAGER